MVAKIYLTSAEGHSGKSSIALGVLEAIAPETPRVGVFRPLIRAHSERDRVLEMLLERTQHTVSYDDCVGVTYDDAHNDPAAALTRIVDRYKRLEAQCDAVIVVGSDFTDVATPTELAFNARIAANLDAPVLLVLGGRETHTGEALGHTTPRSARDIAALAEISKQQLEGEHARLLATVVNRSDPRHLDDITAAVGATLPEVPVWALPEHPLLVAPSVAAVLEATNGTLERGSAELLDREVLGMVVAGMHMEHVLARLTEGAIVVVAADRTETLLALTMAHEAETFPTLSGIVINGDFPINDDVQRLLDGVGSRLPVIRTSHGTYDAVHAIMKARGPLSAASPRKFDTALSLFSEHVDVAELRECLRIDRPGVVTPTMFAYELFQRAKQADAHVVLPEGSDERVLRAASTLLARDIVRLTILGNAHEIRQRAAELGLDLNNAVIIDPLESDLLDTFAEEYARLRAHKQITVDQARERMRDVSYFGTMMVHLGLADGMVSGAAHTTAHTIRPSFEIIKTEPGVSVVSSVFFMALADRVLVYGDCAVNPDPTAAQLADIATSSANTAADFGIEPRVAMLSYSTGTSGSGADVDKVREATQIAREQRPDLLIDGPIQYDAASDPKTGASKLPGSEVAGRATVFIFPDLNTGNNTYKAVQRSAKAVAMGPVLQGLNKPVNDLSRGALVEDILNTVAITAVQAGQRRNDREAAKGREDGKGREGGNTPRSVDPTEEVDSASSVDAAEKTDRVDARGKDMPA